MTNEAGGAHGEQSRTIRSAGRCSAAPTRRSSATPTRSRPCEQAEKLDPDNPEILVEYAEAIGARHGGNLDGEPMRLLERALKIAPEQ